MDNSKRPLLNGVALRSGAPKYIIFPLMVIFTLCLSISYSYAISKPVKYGQTKNKGIIFVNPKEEAVSETRPLVTKKPVLPYTLGPTDVVEVNVADHPELSGVLLVEADGTIMLPLTGDELMAEGLTKEELSKVLAEHMTKYIEIATVTVKIAGYNSKVIYMLGEVGSPGKYPIRGSTIDLREALFQAGLPSNRALTRNILIVTPSDTGEPIYKNINAYEILYKGDLTNNIQLKTGDVVYVPMNPFTKIADMIRIVREPFNELSGFEDDLINMVTKDRTYTTVKVEETGATTTVIATATAGTTTETATAVTGE